MRDTLKQLETWAAPLLVQLSAPRRRVALTQVAIYLRRSQAQRIAAQRNPDGAPYEPRKRPARLRDKKGGIRRRMFEKLRTASHLKRSATADIATVRLGGKSARIARVHHHGLKDKVDWRRRDSPSVIYARRELLGYTDADIEAISDLLLNHVAPRLPSY